MARRPRIIRDYVRGLDTDAPRVELSAGGQIALDSDEFISWVSRTHSFAVEYDLGSFLVIAEKRKRGGRYFVARAYQRGKRSSFYVGSRPSASQLRLAADKLFDTFTADEPAPDATDLQAYVEQLLARETDPRRRAAAEALRALVGEKEP